jgi:ubiquinone/menaquinone biosynthesis C-methylase UbiE
VKTLELQPNDKVIDFGSGTGFLSNLMSKELVGRESWLSCVEISEKWNKIARKKIKRYPNVDFYCGMLYELDMKDNYYDKIVIHWVLHDVGKKHRGKIVDAMTKRLKKGGRIILREPIKEDHGIPESQIKELMKNAGMVEIKSKLIDNRWVGTVLAGFFEKK